jgi:hypothetical protein
MKKIIFLISFFISNYTFGERIPGTIIKTAGDTVQVTLDVPGGQNNFRKMQELVKYYDARGNKHVLKADLIKEVSFDYRSEKVRLVSMPFKNTGLQIPHETDQENILLQLLVDGKVKVYKFFYFEPAGQFGGSLVEKYLLQKEGEEIYEPRFLLFKKDMAQYLCDCPVLIDKIEDRKFKRKDMTELIAEYNDTCGY